MPPEEARASRLKLASGLGQILRVLPMFCSDFSQVSAVPARGRATAFRGPAADGRVLSLPAAHPTNRRGFSGRDILRSTSRSIASWIRTSTSRFASLLSESLLQFVRKVDQDRHVGTSVRLASLIPFRIAANRLPSGARSYALFTPRSATRVDAKSLNTRRSHNEPSTHCRGSRDGMARPDSIGCVHPSRNIRQRLRRRSLSLQARRGHHSKAVRRVCLSANRILGRHLDLRGTQFAASWRPPRASLRATARRGTRQLRGHLELRDPADFGHRRSGRRSPELL